MVENTLDVRLLHAAKSLSDWNNVTTKPKLGEVCLEIQGTTPPLSYKIKIGDGSSTYAQLPYFGSVITTSGNASVVAVDTVTSGGVSKKVLKFYKLTLSATTTNGTTTITPAIGDLILTIQEGNGIDFSTNQDDNVLSIVLEPTTIDTDVTLSDEGTFTAVTVDSNNRAVKRTTFTLPSIANAITEAIESLDVADNTVLTAEWDSTNSQIKFYYTKETDGLVQKGALAYTIDAIDIAPVQSLTEGSLIDITDNGDGGFTIAHDLVAVDTTSAETLNFGDTFGTYTDDDNYGHVNEKTTFTLPNNPVSAGNNTTNKIMVSDGDNTTSPSGVEITTNAPSSNSDNTTVPTSEAVHEAIDSAIENNIIGGNHITVTGSNGQATINHDTPGIGSAVTPGTGTAPGWEGDVIIGVSIDTYGHVAGATKGTLPANPVTAGSTTSDELMKSDGDNTTSPSGFKASNGSIETTTSANQAVTLPTMASVVAYVTSRLTASMEYKGLVSGLTGSDTSKNYFDGINSNSPKRGDVWIVDTLFTVTDAQAATYQIHQTSGTKTYDAGDYFVRNANNTWDPIQGTVRVTNNNATIGTTATTIANVEGVDITVKNPEASTTTKGVVQFVEDIHNATDIDKVSSAKQTWDEFEKRNVQFVEMESIETLIHNLSEEEFINNYAYGIRWTQNGSTATLVGATDLRETMPIHNALRACVYQIVPVSGGLTVSETIDGTTYNISYGARREFLYWLDEDDWTKKSDGTPSVLTGENMTGIAIWHPKFYGKSFDGVTVGSNITNSVYVSLVQYDDTWAEIKEGFVDFAKMQTVTTGGVSYARCFGNPDFTVTNPMTNEMTLSALNTWIQTQKDSSIALTKSQVSLNRVSAQQYALNSGAHLMSLDEYKWIFCWLPAIECAAFTVENNSTWDWQDGSDTNIVTRASLSSAPSFMYYGMYTANYSTITGTTGWAFVPAGYTNVLGTHTGWVKMRLPNSGGTYDSKVVSRWRGFEIQRNIWTNLMGVNPVQTATSGIVDVYTTKNRALWNNNMPINITDSSSSTHDNIVPWNSRNTTTPEYTTLTGWEHVGIQNWSEFGGEFDLGSNANPSYRTVGSVKPDYSQGHMDNYNPRCFRAGGSAANASKGGAFCFASHRPAGATDGNVGFRCCWNVDEYESVMN